MCVHVVSINFFPCIQLTNIYLRPVDLGMPICHFDTKIVAETPIYNLLWISRSSGKSFVDLCSFHCSHMGWGTVLTSVEEYVLVHYITTWCRTLSFKPLWKRDLQIFLLSWKFMSWPKISKCISDLATKGSKNGQETSLRYVQIQMAQ